MKALGMRTPADHLLTFAPSAPNAEGESAPAPRRRDDNLLRVLVAAARDAEVAEHELDRAKALYGEAPTPANLDELRRISVRTLEAEAAFDRAWREASALWFGHPPPES